MRLGVCQVATALGPTLSVSFRAEDRLSTLGVVGADEEVAKGLEVAAAVEAVEGST